MEALDWLFKQFPSYQFLGSKAFKPTLANTHKILDFLDHPEKGLRFIHVAGSNGKGTVSSYLASILTEAGYTVGLFTSPHIAHFRERIRVNGVPIGDQEIEEFVEKIRNEPFDFSPSFFEITLGLALEHFVENACDICILETGLGGRMDATNVITPELSIITTISLEHTQMLGNTLEEIATEKAGIIKPGVPVIFGKGVGTTRPVFEEAATRLGSPFQYVESNENGYSKYFLASYQRENFALVLAAVASFAPEVDQATTVRGIENIVKNTGFYGRLQIVSEKPLTIYDVSHNVEGLQATFEALKSIQRGELHVIYGTSSDKNLDEIKTIFPRESHFYATEFSNPRSAKKEDLQSVFAGIPFKSIAYFDHASESMRVAQSHASEEDTLLVIGSFFLLSDFF